VVPEKPWRLKLLSKDAVVYRELHSEWGRCGRCTNFLKPNRCVLVAGDIRAEFVCDEFKPKKALRLSGDKI
jgi:hypothetical protein